MGISGGKKSKTTSQTTATQTSTPVTPSYIQAPVTDYFGQVQALGSQRPSAQSYGPSASQSAAFQGAANLQPNAAIGQGLDSLRGLLNYSPQVGQLSQTDLTPYYNPFQSQVIDAAQADFQNANDLGLNSLRSRTPAGAFGGSRDAIAQGQLVGDNTRNFASQLAALRSANFGQAQDAARFDIGNRMNADQFGANYRMGAAQNLLAGGAAADANARANIGLQADVGAQQRAVAQQSDPAMQQAQWLATLQSLLGLDPAALIGRTQTGTENSSGTTKESGGLKFGFNLGPFSVGSG